MRACRPCNTHKTHSHTTRTHTTNPQGIVRQTQPRTSPRRCNAPGLPPRAGKTPAYFAEVSGLLQGSGCAGAAGCLPGRTRRRLARRRSTGRRRPAAARRIAPRHPCGHAAAAAAAAARLRIQVAASFRTSAGRAQHSKQEKSGSSAIVKEDVILRPQRADHRAREGATGVGLLGMLAVATHLSS